MGIGSGRGSESGHSPRCALLLGQPPPAATSTAHPPACLLRLSTALSGDPQRAEVRWSDKQEVQWNFIPGKKKKKGPWHELQNRGFGMLITAPFIRQLY